jgi:hypothetical protein
MGASVSTAVNSNTTNDIMNIITNVIISKATSCTGTSNINTDQNIVVSGSTFADSSITQAAELTVDLSCLSSSSTDANLQSEIESQLKQYANTKAEANPAFLNANISTSISNQIATISKNVASTIKIDDIKTCVATTQENLKQSLIVANSSFTDSALSQMITTSVVQRCIFSDASTTSLVNNLASVVDQASQTTASAGISTTALIAIAVISVILIGSVGYIIHKRNSSKKQILNYDQ